MGIYAMSRARSIVESKPFARKDAIQTLTTRFFKGDTSKSTVDNDMSTVGPQHPHHSGFRGRCTAKYWHTFVITTNSSVKVKMKEYISDSLLTAMPMAVARSVGQHQCAKSTGMVITALVIGPRVSQSEPELVS